jgi:stage V sporulation protein AF
MEDIFQGDITERDEKICSLLRLDECFDIIRRNFKIGGRRAVFYSVDGFLKGDVTEKVMEFFYSIEEQDMPEDFGGFLQEKIPYLDIMKVGDELPSGGGLSSDTGVGF